MVDYYRVDPDKVVKAEIKVKGVVDSDLAIGYVTDTDRDNRIMFGAVCRRGGDYRLTHMCYGADYFDPKDMLEFEFPEFFLDAGGNGCPITISKEEFIRALRELGLIDDD